MVGLFQLKFEEKKDVACRYRLMLRFSVESMKQVSDGLKFKIKTMNITHSKYVKFVMSPSQFKFSRNRRKIKIKFKLLPIDRNSLKLSNYAKTTRQKQPIRYHSNGWKYFRVFNISYCKKKKILGIIKIEQERNICSFGELSKIISK